MTQRSRRNPPGSYPRLTEPLVRDNGVLRPATWDEALDRAASNFRDGHTTGFETIERLVTPDLAYTLEIERYVAKVGGSSDLSDVALRVSCMYRLEDDVWKLLHRHADPRVGPQTPESLIQS